jgi:hypothetical protein
MRRNVWLYAQATSAVPPVLTVDIVGKWPIDKIREIADKQIKLAKESFEIVSKVAWYEGLYVRYKSHERWSPYLDKIKAAETALKQGDVGVTESDKKNAYLESWTKARLASEAIHKESELGPTTYATVAVDLSNSAQDLAKKAKDEIKDLGSGLSSSLKWGLGIGAALLLLSQTRKR